MFTKQYNYACIRIKAVRANPPFFVTEERIERPENWLKDGDAYGGMWGSGGAIYCSKHLDWRIEQFKKLAIKSNVKPENIEVVWEEGAKELYEELKNARHYPNYVDEEWVSYKLDNDYTLFKNEERNVELDYIKWFLMDKGMSEEKINRTLQEARIKAYKKLKQHALKDIERHKLLKVGVVDKQFHEQQIRKKYEEYVKYCKLLGEPPLPLEEINYEKPKEVLEIEESYVCPICGEKVLWNGSNWRPYTCLNGHSHNSDELIRKEEYRPTVGKLVEEKLGLRINRIDLVFVSKKLDGCTYVPVQHVPLEKLQEKINLHKNDDFLIGYMVMPLQNINEEIWLDLEFNRKPSEPSVIKIVEKNLRKAQEQLNHGKIEESTLKEFEEIKKLSPIEQKYTEQTSLDKWVGE